LTLTSSAARAQESILVDVNLVAVAFSVRDVNGSLVNNLTKDDFEVTEDAVPQQIAHFARSLDIPLTLGLILDASGGQKRFNKQHRHDLEVFLHDVLGPNDGAFLVGFGNHIRLVSDYSPTVSWKPGGATRETPENLPSSVRARFATWEPPSTTLSTTR